MVTEVVAGDDEMIVAVRVIAVGRVNHQHTR